MSATAIQLAIEAFEAALAANPIAPGDCEKLQRLISALQQVYSEQCPIL